MLKNSLQNVSATKNSLQNFVNVILNPVLWSIHNSTDNYVVRQFDYEYDHVVTDNYSCIITSRETQGLVNALMMNMVEPSDDTIRGFCKGLRV